MAKSAKVRLGRPPIPAEKRRSKNLTFRVRPDLEKSLTTAAQTSGRSVSEEIEHRLEKSFAAEHVLSEALDLAYGSDLTSVLFALGDAARNAIGSNLNSNWTDDPQSYGMVWGAVMGVLTAFRPSEDLRPNEMLAHTAGFDLWLLRDRLDHTPRDERRHRLYGSLLRKMKIKQMQPDGTTTFVGKADQ